MLDSTPTNISPCPPIHHRTQINSQSPVEGSQMSNVYNAQKEVGNETPIAMFQPPGFGSFNSSRSINVENITPQGQVTHSVLLTELSRMYEGLVQKMVMDNGALMATLKADNKSLREEMYSLRREVHSTYLVQSIPGGVLDMKKPKQREHT
ncbi:hypothetical protein GcC1_122013 [Golovinomyces cichoracearum]|uniref:Uncharacterized protein n=1 Tax=Golovinomyces cichoracearum TaxID=62708 RepID=A0A420I6P4_9PEZI|nr:hypothetical protein GcC1_122013 [Golovinomyces cichoracearum]